KPHNNPPPYPPPLFCRSGPVGSKVHQAIIKAKKSKTGVSIHKVNAEYDKGFILSQKTIPIEKNETALELEKKVKQIEKPFYFETICQILNESLKTN
ncbi:MAG: formyltransferase family protein, partial [Oligoflexia bacterium]|nr:formyltransferase family protein [Oligoflexia bacterium]